MATLAPIKQIMPKRIAIHTRTKEVDYAQDSFWQYYRSPSRSSSLDTLAYVIYQNAVANVKRPAPRFSVFKAKNVVCLLLADMETQRNDPNGRVIRTTLFCEFSLEHEKEVFSTAAFLLDEELLSEDSVASKLKDFVRYAENIFAGNTTDADFSFPVKHIDAQTSYSNLPDQEDISRRKLLIYSSDDTRHSYANYLCSSSISELHEFCFVSTGAFSAEKCLELIKKIGNSDVFTSNDARGQIIIFSLSESLKTITQPSLGLAETVIHGLAKVDEIGQHPMVKGTGFFFIVLAVGLSTYFATQITERRNEIKELSEQIIQKNSQLESERIALTETCNKKLLESQVLSKLNQEVALADLRKTCQDASEPYKSSREKACDSYTDYHNKAKALGHTLNESNLCSDVEKK